MPATLTEIAKAAGVSISTVSRVLNNSDHPIADGTRQRIFALARDLNYQPNLMARGLRLETSSTIGIIVESMSSPFVPPMITGIQDTLKPAGYLSFIINTYENPDLEIDSIRALNNRQSDGIIFVATWDRSPDVLEEVTRKPHVFVHRHFDSYADNAVSVDERWGAHLAVSHLVSLGHRKIAFINGPEDWDASIYRLEGYKAELEACGLPYDPHLVYNGDWVAEAGREALNWFAERGVTYSAIFAANDLIALGAIYALQDSGKRVPEDVAVVGYDDREFASLVRPSITTVTLPAYELGQAAANLLLKKIKGQEKISRTVEVRGKLLIRESCGTPLAARTTK